MERDLTIWRSTSLLTKRKMYCIRNYNKRNHYGGVRFCLDEGDLPCWVIRTEPGLRQDQSHYTIDNHRGRAYATRNRLRFHKKPNKFKGFALDC